MACQFFDLCVMRLNSNAQANFKSNDRETLQTGRQSTKRRSHPIQTVFTRLTGTLEVSHYG